LQVHLKRDFSVPKGPSPSVLPLNVALGARLRWRHSINHKGSRLPVRNVSLLGERPRRRGRGKSTTSHDRWCNMQKSLHIHLKESNDRGRYHNRPPKPSGISGNAAFMAGSFMNLMEKIRLRAVLREQGCKVQKNTKGPLKPRAKKGLKAREKRSLKRADERGELVIRPDLTPSERSQVDLVVEAGRRSRSRRQAENIAHAAISPSGFSSWDTISAVSAYHSVKRPKTPPPRSESPETKARLDKIRALFSQNRGGR